MYCVVSGTTTGETAGSHMYILRNRIQITSVRSNLVVLLCMHTSRVIHGCPTVAEVLYYILIDCFGSPHSVLITSSKISEWSGSS